jgi:hypothetical protein
MLNYHFYNYITGSLSVTGNMFLESFNSGVVGGTRGTFQNKDLDIAMHAETIPPFPEAF